MYDFSKYSDEELIEMAEVATEGVDQGYARQWLDDLKDETDSFSIAVRKQLEIQLKPNDKRAIAYSHDKKKSKSKRIGYPYGSTTSYGLDRRSYDPHKSENKREKILFW